VFGFIGLDDRFMLHELFGGRLGIQDALILLSIGVLEMILLLTLGNLRGRSNESKYYIGAAALFFCAMVLIDGLVPPEAVPRLSLEDLSKTWGDVFLFLFAWSICRDKIHTLKQKANSTTST
jgi:hypothetical protein